MPLKPQDAPCWVIAYPDGTPAGRWDERHFADEDEAADVLDCEAPAERDGLAPRELPAPCLTIVCNGCGEPNESWPDDYLIGHFTDAADAWGEATDMRFGENGAAWCEDCAAKLPVCTRCDERILGTPVTDEGDPARRTWCSEGCHDADGEAYDERRLRTV